MFESIAILRTAGIPAALALFLGLGACASSPEYVAADDAEDYGYHSTELAENRYRVTYNGNSRTDLGRTRDFALLRAAELTLQQGYSWFEVVDRVTTSTEQTDAGPHTGISDERTYEVERNCGLLGCSERVRPSTATGVQVDSRSAEAKHSHVLEVLMGNGEMPEKGGNYYQASEVVNTIWERL